MTQQHCGCLFSMKPDGTIEFTRPDGSIIPTNGDLNFSGNVVSLVRDNRRCGTEIDSTTIKSRWLGERMDYDIGIYALWRRDHKDES